MASYIKILKEDNGDITYPQTKGSAVLLDGGSDLESVLAAKADASTVNQKITVGDVQSTDIVANAVTTAKIAGSAVTSAKVDWSTLDGSETGWKYLGQVKLASAGASLTFNLPAQYDNYKIIAAGEMATGSNTTCQLQLLRSESVIPSVWGVLDVSGGTVFAGTRDTADDQFSMAGCNQYDTINMEMTSFKTASSQWRKYQGYQTRTGSAFVMRQYNGRFNSNTEPNQVRIWTSATFSAGAVIKVWASNNT